ncbi:SDR family NAD(P)-dependent oxidoreductase [Rheinheimera salexigens]|uniref:3-oxoacyl-ACP reductase n=1 Tax=Rheinheimera salexigens TaxID=1628148 RepID=A0A1E7Q4W3_9GAMM|nr:SDR family oxidoreductase [Rheinheimera salexigens]OEY69215.1 hypothetical protein BI198_06240 [Rheinheimera salexigens]
MILIIGASGGIGSYLANSFINDGFDVKGTYNNTAINNNFTKLDVSNEEEVKQWVEQISAKLKQITVINCVGINYNCFGHKADLEQWKNVIDVNLIGTFNVIKYLLPYMRAEKFGRIINLSSVVPQIGVAGTSAYAASKSGLWGMVKSLTKENAGLGITINNLNLGYFDAGMIAAVPEAVLATIKETIPAKRFGTPNEIYKAVNMLMDIEYINGASIDINGGI